jgi:hypothetical protein
MSLTPITNFGSKDEQETHANLNGKRVPDLEFDVRELEEENKRLKLELKGKKKYRHSSTEDLRQDNEWTFD